jgi:RNA polymerase sigma factor (sigma-70 family)
METIVGGETMKQLSTPVYEAYTDHGVSLKRFIGRFLRSPSDVEDVAQEAFLRAFTVELTRPIEQPKSFLFRIAKHLALSQLTRKSRRITEYIEDVDESSVIQEESSAEDEISANQILELHYEATMALSPQCRDVYLLRKVHGLSHKEIAERRGIAVSTVEKHLIKAVEHCDRYVRERTESRPSPAPNSDHEGRQGRLLERDSGRRRRFSRTDIDRTTGEAVAHSDGRR